MTKHEWNRKVYYAYAAFVVLYFAITFLTPPDPTVIHKYHLTNVSLRLLSLTVAVPLAGIWLAAFYGFAKLRGYAQPIKGSKDGRQVVKITTGIMILALGLPISAIIAGGLALLVRHHVITIAASTIINNYIALLFPLAAFVMVSRGTRGLSELVKSRPGLRSVHALVLFFAAIGVGYCYFIFNQALPAERGAAGHPLYYLPTWLVLISQVIPYLYLWFIGLLAAYELFLYDTKVAGKLYKRGWRQLAYGITLIISMSIVVQYLTTSTLLDRFGLNTLLLVVYSLLIFIALGYVLVASAANKLQKIEEA